MKQTNLSFAKIDNGFNDYWKNENRKHHGGEYSIGKRKTRRPLSTRKPIHLVMRSEKATGAMSFRLPKNHGKITELITKYSKRFDVRIYKHSINSNHLHFVLRAKTRSDFQNFLRVLAGMIGRFLLNAQRGRAKGSLWDMLAFTRVSEWGRAFDNLKAYVIQNTLESAGVISYKPRKFGGGGRN